MSDWYDPTSWDSGDWTKVGMGVAGGGLLPFLPGMGGGQTAPAGLGNVSLPYFQQDRDRLQGLLNGHNPFASGGWDTLIGQLQQRASGQGPSVAVGQYQQASQDSANQIAALAHGAANPAAMRTAAIQQGRIGQGLAQGSALARTQEMQAAQQALTQALGTRDQLNQGAYLGLLGDQLGLSRGQLSALQGNQNFWLQQQQIDQQRQAAQLQALSSLLGTAGKAGMGRG